jgi:hypothetical protein
MLANEDSLSGVCAWLESAEREEVACLDSEQAHGSGSIGQAADAGADAASVQLSRRLGRAKAKV